MSRNEYEGPRTLLDHDTYVKRRQEVAEAQASIDGLCSHPLATTELIQYQDDLKYIRHLEQLLYNRNERVGG